MSVKKNIYFCLSCQGAAFSKEKVTHSNCQEFPYIMEEEVAFKMTLTRWGRFVNWFWSRDIGWGLAFMGLVVMNSILLPQLHLSFAQSMGECFSFGIVIPRLIK